MQRLLATVVAAALIVGRCGAQDAYDLPWRIAENGELEVRLPANGRRARELQFDEWTPLFPGLFARGPADGAQLAWLQNWGTMLAVPLLVHGDGGAAAIDEAPVRMRKLGIATTIDWFALRVTPDPLLDLLHVRHLAAHDLMVTSYGLKQMAADEARDPFVRAAAAAALAARRSGKDDAAEVAEAIPPRRAAGALQDALARLPDDVDLVLGVHGAALPSTAPLLAAWRQFLLRYHSMVAMATTGSLSPAQMTVGQLVMDRPGQLPFEIARRFGNWRVDHALLALRRGERPGFWLHLGGAFHTERIAEALREGEFAIERASAGEVRATVHGVLVHATATSLVAWTEDLALGRSGSWVPKLHDRAAANAPPIWLHVPATSRLTATIAPGIAFDAGLDPSHGRATARATCPDRAAAAALEAAWLAWQAARGCDPAAPIPAPDPKERDAREPYGGGVTWGELASMPPGCREDDRSRLVWRQLVQAVRGEARDGSVEWTLDFARFEPLDLVGLFGDSPARMIQMY